MGKILGLDSISGFLIPINYIVCYQIKREMVNPMKVKKLLLISSTVLLLGLIVNIQTSFAKDVIVLPIKSNVRHGKKGVLERAMTQILINQLVLSNIKTLSLKDLQAMDKNRLEAIKRRADYVVSGELERYNDYCSLTLLVTNREGKYSFRKRRKIIVSDKPFFKSLRSAKKVSIKLNNPQVFSLVNPLAKDLIDFIQSDRQEQTQRDKQIELMFVIGSTTSLKDEIRSLKRGMRQIVRKIHSLRPDMTVRIGITDYSRIHDSLMGKAKDRQSFFTENIMEVEDYLDSLAKSRKQGKGNAMDGLRHALRGGDWSIYKKDPKILFLLTDQSIPKGIGRKTLGQLVIVPFQKTFRYRKSISQNDIYKRIVLEAPAGIEKSLMSKLIIMDRTLIHSKAQSYFMDKLGSKNQEAILKKIDKQYHVPYIMTGRVDRKRDIFKLTLNLKSRRTNRTILTIQKEAVGYDALLAMIHPIGEQISDFIARNRIVNKPERRVGSQFDDIINLAKSKSVKVYTIGCSGIDLQTQKTLTRVSELMKGSYTNPIYHIMAFLSQNERMSLVYHNQKLYQVKGSNSIKHRVDLQRAGKKDLSQSQTIPRVEEVLQFLLDEGYSIQSENGIDFQKININLSQIITKITEDNINSYQKLDQIIFKSGSFDVPIHFGNLTPKEYNRMKRWMARQDEVIIAVKVLPSIAYPVYFQENNRRIQKMLFFQFHPLKIKVFKPKYAKFVPYFLIQSIYKLNVHPFFYSSQGMTSDKYWFIRGRIKSITYGKSKN